MKNNKRNQGGKKMKSFELVLGGHPDKFCDIVAETVAEYLRKDDPKTHTSVEVAWFNQMFAIGGETNADVSGEKYNEIIETIWDLWKKYGYTKKTGYSTDLALIYELREQSQDIQDIVKTAGTGDNGVFFGGWHKTYSPTIMRLKSLAKALTPEVLREYNYAADGKFIAQVNENGQVEVITINIAHIKGKRPIPSGIKRLIKQHLQDNEVSVIVNPKGDWDTYGGVADSGLTGRKLACDSQCGLFHHGGGALFGKDLSKADRSIYLYLTAFAKKQVEKTGEKMKEYVAHTIIGDETVRFRDLATGEEFTENFQVIKDYTANMELDFFGNITDNN